jgi:hypothetical protein
MTAYCFLTVWRLGAPIQSVYDCLAAPSEWPTWWRGVEKVEPLEAGEADGLHSLRRFTWKSALPYRLAFEMRSTRVDAPRLLEGRSQGELEGFGRWELTESEGWTTVRYTWEVGTTKAWMNALAPLLRPAFRWNHDVVMGWGFEGLCRRLNCQGEDLSHRRA